MQVDGTGTARAAYWSAYNTKEQRTDFYVGPDNLDTFQSHPSTFAELAARVPVGGLEDWEVESGRTVASLLAGQPGQAAEHFGRSWGDAVTNTRFIEKTIENTVLSLAGATALDDIKAAQDLDGTAARSQLVRGSVETSPDGVGLHEYQPNANGAVRSTEEARAIAKQNGVELPDWIEIRSNPRVPIEEKLAAYRLGGPAPLPPFQRAEWDRLAPDGVVVVNEHPSVFASDEAIVGVLAHEEHELTSLQASVEQNSMRYRDVHRAVDPTGSANLHGQAWEVADLQVIRMRAQTPAARAAIEARLSTKLSTFDAMNGIER